MTNSFNGNPHTWKRVFILKQGPGSAFIGPSMTEEENQKMTGEAASSADIINFHRFPRRSVGVQDG